MNIYRRVGFWFWLLLLLAPFAAWARRALALGAQGHVGFFGLGKETAWGTAVAVTDYAELLSENLTTTIDRFGTRNIFSGFYEPDDYAGARRSAGGITLAAFPAPLGHLLKAAFNSISQSVVLSGFLWNNRFSSIKSEFADGVPRQPYTLEVYRDVTSSHRYAGALLNKLTLALAPNQDLRVSAEWIAKARTLLSKSTPTFPGSPADPFTFDTASVQLAGAATARMEAFTLSVDNQLEGILKPVIDMIQNGEDYKDILNKLAGTYPEMNQQALTEMLARAIFVTETWGRLNAGRH